MMMLSPAQKRNRKLFQLWSIILVTFEIISVVKVCIGRPLGEAFPFLTDSVVESTPQASVLYCGLVMTLAAVRFTVSFVPFNLYIALFAAATHLLEVPMMITLINAPHTTIFMCYFIAFFIMLNAVVFTGQGMFAWRRYSQRMAVEAAENAKAHERARRLVEARKAREERMKKNAEK